MSGNRKRKRKESSIGPILKSLARVVGKCLVWSIILYCLYVAAMILIIFLVVRCPDPTIIDTIKFC